MKTALMAIAFFGLTTLVYADPAWKDLTPVTRKPAPQQPPLVVAEGGKSGLSLCVMSPEFDAAVKELQDCIAAATGAKLPIVDGKAVLPAIVLGDCPEARAAGLSAAALPPEGFEIKTAPEAVFIVGSAWGAYDFLERFVGVRWYWPADKGGRCILPVLGVTEPLGSGKKWCGQITRHRTTDRRTDKGEWENQKLNAHAGGFNANTADFTEFIFRE
jgi:hypothetical protein